MPRACVAKSGHIVIRQKNGPKHGSAASQNVVSFDGLEICIAKSTIPRSAILERKSMTMTSESQVVAEGNGVNRAFSAIGFAPIQKRNKATLRRVGYAHSANPAITTSAIVTIARSVRSTRVGVGSPKKSLVLILTLSSFTNGIVWVTPFSIGGRAGVAT